jgi:hypothetical protein
MEPSTELAEIPPTPVAPPPDPVVARMATDVGEILDRATLEALCRTEPKAFLKFATSVLGMRQQGGDRHHTIVNVVNAIPRSPLDGLPPGFAIK